MSQSQFATHFGVSVRTVQEWEQGREASSGGNVKDYLMVDDLEKCL
jgi:DNA-binding transcriptional regulator YiaG